MKNQKSLMNGIATLNLMAVTTNPERFKRLLSPHTLIDAKVNFLTCEGETITIDVFEFLDIKWTANCPESGELLEV